MRGLVRVLFSRTRSFRSRSLPSSQSVSRAKTIEEEIGIHPMLLTDIDESEAHREKLVHSISKLAKQCFLSSRILIHLFCACYDEDERLALMKCGWLTHAGTVLQQPSLRCTETSPASFST
jgi:hypothetical protein